MKIAFCGELPQWIISSDVAAYHPHSRTIYVRRGLGSSLPGVLAHELCHWAIHALGLPEHLHTKLDRGRGPV